VTGILGEGGMGAVYIAEHLMLGRKVAIKRLHPELVGDEKAVARFQREARAAAATGHEHIVEVLDLGYAEDGAPYLVMEHLRGSSLAQVLRQDGRLGLSRTANIVGQVLAALEAVHQREIVHRDLKPDNIFLTRRGGVAEYVKVSDFGISKRKHEEGEPTNLRRTGVTMGTPYYMSPEQARGMRKLDHRVDLYAVAVITYECLTGRLPLIGDNYHALLQQILRVEPIPPSSLVPGLPPALDAVVLRGLAKDPAARFSSAAEMLAALAPFGARTGDVAAMLATQPETRPRPQAAIEAPRSVPQRVDARAPTEALVSAPPASVPATTSSAVAPTSAVKQTGAVRRSETGRVEPAGRPATADSSPSLSGIGSPSGSAPAAPARSTSATNRVAVPAKPAAAGTMTARTTGPKYFFAASDDWGSTAERPGRASVGGGPSAGAEVAGSSVGAGPSVGTGSGATASGGTASSGTASSGTASSGTASSGTASSGTASSGTASSGTGYSPTSSAPGAPLRRPPAGERGPASGERGMASPEPASVRETPPSRPVRDELAVKGALIAGLLDHMDAELGSAEATRTLSTLEPALRNKLDGVILPMAWLPLGLFEAILGAADREASEPGRALGAGRAAADRELSTTHRLFLQTASPATVLDRIPHLHRVYFSRGEAKVSPAANGARVDVDGMSAESASLVAWLSGFWQRTLELAGARDVKVIATSARGRGEERTSVTLRWR